MTWPPDLDALKLDVTYADTIDDAALQQVLDAAVAYVERVRAGDLDFGADESLPAPSADVELGTIRLASRWHSRRATQYGVFDLGNGSTGIIPGWDSDIEKLLGIGRYRGPVIA